MSESTINEQRSTHLRPNKQRRGFGGQAVNCQQSLESDYDFCRGMAAQRGVDADPVLIALYNNKNLQ